MRGQRSRAALAHYAPGPRARHATRAPMCSPPTSLAIPIPRTPYHPFIGQFFVFFDWVHDTLTVPGSRRAGNGIGPELGSEAPVSKTAKRGGATKGVKAH